MAKSSKRTGRKGSKENPVDAQDIERAVNEMGIGPAFKVLNAKNVDDFCIYTLEITEGIGTGNIHPGIKGAGIVRDSYKDAVARIRVHLAYMEGYFPFELKEMPAGPDSVPINSLMQLLHHENVELFRPIGFTLSGPSDEQAVQIEYNVFKRNAASYFHSKTGKIMLDKLSSYKYAEDLNDCIELWKSEVARYELGHYTPVTKHDDKASKKVKQMKITDAQYAENETDDVDPGDQIDNTDTKITLASPEDLKNSDVAGYEKEPVDHQTEFEGLRPNKGLDDDDFEDGTA